MKIKLKYLLVFILCLFCANLSHVNAAGCFNGVVCQYSFCGQRGAATDPGYLAQNCSNMRVEQVNLDIVFRCSDSTKSVNDCNSFESWVYAFKNAVGADGTGRKEINQWGNYDSLFHRTDALFKDYFNQYK